MMHPPSPSRASTALRVTFRVPPSLQPHMEVLPKYGVVQGESSYSAQLKFTPKASILEWEGLTKEGALIMPVEVHVVDQVRDLKHDTLQLNSTVTIIMRNFALHVHILLVTSLIYDSYMYL